VQAVVEAGAIDEEERRIKRERERYRRKKRRMRPREVLISDSQDALLGINLGSFVT
jgi:hypothetical protein